MIRETFSNFSQALRCDWKQCLLQSLVAASAIFIILLVLTVEEAVIVASIGATTFIVFAIPSSPTAKPRNVIGGHFTGIIAGSLCALIPHERTILAILIYALSVGISMFIMILSETEHPPAAGTALGIAISGFSLYVTGTMVISVLALSLIHYFFKDFLIDLC